MPDAPPPVKPAPAVTPDINPVSVKLNCPLAAVKPVPAIPATKSAMLSFFELLSSASMIAILSFATLTVAAVNSFKSSAKETVPLVPPPLKPSPAVTPYLSPASLVKLNAPDVLL